MQAPDTLSDGAMYAILSVIAGALMMNAMYAAMTARVCRAHITEVRRQRRAQRMEFRRRMARKRFLAVMQGEVIADALIVARREVERHAI